jgi:hypothetical protein
MAVGVLGVFMMFSGGIRAADHTVLNPECIAPIYWCRGCSPTSASMALSYYDFYSGGMRLGTGRLIRHWTTLSKFSDGTGPLCNVPDILEDLRLAMDTDVDGNTGPFHICPGITHVTNSLRGYVFSSWMNIGTALNDFCFPFIQVEINDDHPCLWSVSYFDGLDLIGHTDCVWGYTDDKYLILYNTWSLGRDDWYYRDYGNGEPLDFQGSHTIHPLEVEGNNQLYMAVPDTGAVLHGFETYNVRWRQYGTLIDNVRIGLSTDSGVTYYMKANNVPSSEGWNAYPWLVPSTVTTEARISVGGFQGSGPDEYYVAGDSSRGNFAISAPRPRVMFNPTELDVFCPQGHDASPVTFEVWNLFTNTLIYSVSGEVGWISWVLPSNWASGGEHVTHEVGFSSSGLMAGTYVAPITITAPDASNTPQQIAVTLRVMSLAEALDTTSLLWNTTGGDNDWQAQLDISHDGEDAAQCLLPGDTVVRPVLSTEVVGPGTLTFWWKIGTAAVGAGLWFEIDDDDLDSITGDTDWTQVTIQVPTGTRTLNWVLVPGASVATAGWVDQVAYVRAPSIGVSRSTVEVTCLAGHNADDETLEVWNAGGGTLNYTIVEGVSWLSVTPSSGSTTGDQNSHTIAFSTSRLIPGTYEETFSVAAAGVGNSPQTITVTLEVVSGGTLADALDNTSLKWQTSGDADWFYQTSTTHDGTDAAEA